VDVTSAGNDYTVASNVIVTSYFFSEASNCNYCSNKFNVTVITITHYFLQVLQIFYAILITQIAGTATLLCHFATFPTELILMIITMYQSVIKLH
jgi:hypothetical protein